MKIKKFYNFINEKFIGHILDPINYKYKYDIYMNPKNLKNISPNCRGFIDKNGNLFVVDSENIVHYNLYNHLNKMGYLEFTKNFYATTEMVPVQRYENTNDIYIGEGYSKIFDYDNYFINIDINDFLDKIQILLNKAKKINSSINFNIETINDINILI